MTPTSTDDMLEQVRQANRSITAVFVAESAKPLSESLSEAADTARAVAKTCEYAMGVAVALGQVEIAAGAGGTKVVALATEDILRAVARNQQGVEEARQKERQAAERIGRGIERDVDRGMQDFKEHLREGDYKDPPDHPVA